MRKANYALWRTPKFYTYTINTAHYALSEIPQA
jgi:hypothetical protein